MKTLSICAIRAIAGTVTVVMVLWGVSFSEPACGQSLQDGKSEPDPWTAEDLQLWQVVRTKGLTYLTSKGQAEDGSFSKEAGPAVTALCTYAMLRHGRLPSEPAVAKALSYLEGFIQPDGGIYAPGTYYQNYETCIAILCFQAANRDGRYRMVLERAQRFVKQIQWDETEQVDAADFRYGGAGYGRSARPDLSNTAFLIEALREAGNPAEDEAIQRALIFVSRCQNLESPHNTTPFAALNPDGGFYYTPAGGGQSQAGTTESGGLRSYASMTYAGLKSMIYAGVGPDDPRVKAAFEWAQKHYDLTTNPGMGSAGLYYYYHTFAKALDAMKVDVLIDSQGRAHRWRKELLAALAQKQQPDGSWINDNPRWLEGDANLVTAYALLALAYCQPPQAP
jgi:squalene-hopene/tetraprenyl-beta-curcumene cyclase